MVKIRKYHSPTLYCMVGGGYFYLWNVSSHLAAIFGSTAEEMLRIDGWTDLINLSLPLVRGVLPHQLVEFATVEVGVVVGEGGRVPGSTRRVGSGRGQCPRVGRNRHLDAAVTGREAPTTGQLALELLLVRVLSP